jgi:hypothetical protein
VENQVGTFSVEDIFRITDRGWVLAGEVEGQISPGYRLAFGNDVVLRVRAVNWIRTAGPDKFGLLIANHFESRQELVDLNIIGATAQILE